MIGRIVPLALVLLIAPATAKAAEFVTKAWLFTTENSLTADLKLAAGTEPDWSASTVRLAPITAGSPAVTLPLAKASIVPGPDAGTTRVRLTDLKVELWSPTQPRLYRVTLDLAARNGSRQQLELRTGFRSFATNGGQLYLNGKPVFLRGLAINPPNRGIPEELERSRGFAEDYVRFLLSLHVNIIRIPDDPTWYDVCDELGMMVFGGNYSGRVNGKGAEQDPVAAATWYREDKFHVIANHPSLVIYALTNEVAGEGASGAKWDAFLGKVHQQLQPWDPTRLYIANAGYGYGRVGEINDLHRYWGWYYQTPFTFLHLRDYLAFPDKVQPLTFTECVGNYNGPGGQVNLTPNHKNPLAQQNWTGHAPSAEQGALEYEHQSFTTRQATELFRRLRPINRELSGVFPFTILFDRWHDITSFGDMQPKPAAWQLRTSYQPVLVSWELYTPQVFAGTELRPIAHLVNDADDRQDLTGAKLEFELRDNTERAIADGRVDLPNVPYYGTARLPIALKIPATAQTGTYALHARVLRGNTVVSENRVPVFVANRDYVASAAQPANAVALLDNAGKTAAAFESAGIAFQKASAAESTPAGTIVIGEDALAALSPGDAQALRGRVEQGARLLVLRQTGTATAPMASLLPVRLRWPTSDIDDPAYPPPPRPSRNGFYVNPERPLHPVFAGIDRRQLRVFSDYTGWDEQKPGMPKIYPVSDGFVLVDNADAKNTAVLANYGPGLDAMALAEFFVGKGSVILCGLDLAARTPLDPVAARLLRNLVAYAAQPDGHDAHPLIDSPIVWGKYETERGVLTGIVSGLMLNSRPALTGAYRDIPITVTKDGHEFAGGAGGWNSRPGIVYVPFGRRPFGPYIHRSWSGVPEPRNAESTEGEGRFWCRVLAGRAKVVHRVFNPAAESLAVHLSANGQTVDATIPAGETLRLEVPLAATDTTVENTIRGDRRLVLLETAFE